MSMAPNYLVEVRDRDFIRRGQIAPEYLDLMFTEVFRGIGSWQLKLPAEHPLLPLLKEKGSGIVITETWDGGERTYSGRTRSCKLDQDATDPVGTWTISGTDDGVLAAATVVYPSPTLAADAQTEAYWNLSGNGETVMKQAVRLNAGDLALPARQYPWLSVPTNLNRGAAASANARFDVLGDLLQALGAQSGLGWSFYQQLDGIVFDVYEPADRTAFIRLDIATGGLESSELAFGAPNATEVLVLGQGEGAERTVLPVTTTEAADEATAWALRWEVTKDQRNTDDPIELADAGNEILNEAAATTRSLKVSPSDAPGQELGRDWGLGDTITVVIDGQETQAIVTQIATAIGSAGVIKQATVGDPVGYDWEAKVSSKLTSQAKRIDRLENYVDTTPVPVPTQGTTAERDALYPAPGTAAGRVALAAKRIRWFNTDKGWEEQYFAQYNDAGASPMFAANTHGWKVLGRPLLHPTALTISGTGGAVDRGSHIEVASGALSVLLQGIFTDDFEDYEVILRATDTIDTTAITFRTAVGSTVNTTAGAYGSSVISVSTADVITGVYSADNFALIGEAGTYETVLTGRIMSPKSATTRTQWHFDSHNPFNGKQSRTAGHVGALESVDGVWFGLTTYASARIQVFGIGR